MVIVAGAREKTSLASLQRGMERISALLPPQLSATQRTFALPAIQSATTDGNTAQALVDSADRAMYFAKKSGARFAFAK